MHTLMCTCIDTPISFGGCETLPLVLNFNKNYYVHAWGRIALLFKPW